LGIYSSEHLPRHITAVLLRVDLYRLRAIWLMNPTLAAVPNMPSRAPLSIEAVAFAQGIDQHNTLDGVVAATADVGRRFGIETLAFCMIPNRQQGFADTLLARKWPKWPEEWFSDYNRNNYIRIDPVAHELRSATRPFRWSDIRVDATKREGMALMHRRRDFGFNDAVVVPVHNPTGLPAFVSLSGRHIDVPDAELLPLYVVALSAFERVRDLQKPMVKPKLQLSPREREVLTWVADGKSAWEIGMILNISKRTADEHVKTAARKLGVRSRSHAVAIALKDRHILT
jgi:LuxR family quorum sensing-dependent transcriptional regulator